MKKKTSPLSGSTSNKDDQFLVRVRPDFTMTTVATAPPGDRMVGLAAKQAGKILDEYISISPEKLQSQLLDFLAKMDAVIQKLPETIGEFGLESVELKVEITAKGSVGLLGTGGELGGSGGLTFTLKRKANL